MKVETIELPDSEVALSLEIDDARLQQAVDAACRRAATRVSIAGFRRGKAPRPLVERVVGKESLLHEALDQLLPQVFHEAVEQTKIRPVMDPEFDVESLEPLRAKATVVVEPHVTLGDYRSIRRAPKPATLDPETVESAVQALRERHAQWVPVERPAQLGDLVTVNGTGDSGGTQVFHREELDYRLESPSSAPVPGFAEQIVGMAAGEDRAFDLAVPKEEEWGSFAGQMVAFRVTLLDVKERELPELDDAFAETLGHPDRAALSAHVEAQLREAAEAAAQRALEQEVLDESLLFCTVKVPEKLADQQTHRAYERLAEDLDSRGLTIEQYLQVRGTTGEELRASLRVDAERSLKRRFVLQSIAAEEGLEVAEEEIDAKLRELLASMKTDGRGANRAPDMVRARETVCSSILEARAAQWLVQNATAVAPPGTPSLPDADGENQQ